MSERFKFHSLKQERAAFSDKSVLLLGAGTQYGKTTVGALRMAIKIHQSKSKEDAFIITSPTYKTMMQSTLPPFLKLMKGKGVHDKKNDVFRINEGGLVYLRTETDPDSIVGITNVKHIWGDEAGKYRLYFWENIQGRADFCGCGVDLTTSPYALNWVYKDLIKPFRAGKRQDIEYVWAPSWENPYHSLFDPSKREQKRATMDSRRFDMLYGGEFGKMVGLVYDCYSEDENQCDPFPMPKDARIVAGVDWGYTDRFALKIRAITAGGNHYGVSEFSKSGMILSEIIELCKQMKRIWNIQTFYCDPSRPDSIEEFNRAGLTAIAAENSIRLGIDRHYELLKTRRLKYFRGKNPHTIDEIETYHFPEVKDLGPDEDSKEQDPVDQNNHCLDAERYLTIMTFHSAGTKLVPSVPSEAGNNNSNDLTADKRIARILKPVREYNE